MRVRIRPSPSDDVADGKGASSLAAVLDGPPFDKIQQHAIKTGDKALILATAEFVFRFGDWLRAEVQRIYPKPPNRPTFIECDDCECPGWCASQRECYGRDRKAA